VRKGSRDLLLKFLDSLYISGTVRSRNAKFCTQIQHQGCWRKKCKIGSKGSGRGHVTYFWYFGTPSISRERLEVETPNFACIFISRGTNERNAKLGQKWPERGHVTYFWNFGTPSISRERLELETPNFAHRFINWSSNERNAKLGQKGQKGVTWPTFEILGLPSYVGNGCS